MASDVVKVANVTGAQFGAAIVAGDGLVLVDFWSPGCMPCRTLKPIVDDLAADFAGEVTVCKVDVATESALAERLAVRGVPTLALFRNGEELDRIMGLRTRSQLVTWIEGRL